MHNCCLSADRKRWKRELKKHRFSIDHCKIYTKRNYNQKDDRLKADSCGLLLTLFYKAVKMAYDVSEPNLRTVWRIRKFSECLACEQALY